MLVAAVKDLMGRRIRLGLLLDSFTQPRWVYEAVRLALDVPGVELALVVLNATESEVPQTRSLVARLWSLLRNHRYLLAAVYDWVDGWRSPPSFAFEQVDMRSLLASVPVLRVQPRRSAHRDAFSDDDVRRIQDYRLDVAVRFGFRILAGPVLGIARYGVWSYHHGDNRRYRGGPPGFWEVMEGSPVSGAVLQVLSEVLDGGKTLYRGLTATVPFSARRNRERVTLMAIPFLARALRRLAEVGEPHCVGRGHPVVEPYSRRLYRRPENRDVLPALGRLLLRYGRSHAAAFLTKQRWTIGYYLAQDSDSDVPLLAAYRYRLLEPPHDRFWADPFPVDLGSGKGVLVEEFAEREGRGCIAFLELGQNGLVGAPVRVIDADYHLSYPFVFSYRGSTFLMPESAERRRLEVWRAVRFPYEWTLEAVSLEGLSLRDPTLVEVAGRWWLFAEEEGEFGGVGGALALFHSMSPLGPWVPHRCNPVLTDATCARPAGRPFAIGGDLFRPAQIGVPNYGWGITFQRVVALDEWCYEEVPVGRIEPAWRPDVAGIHTINAAGGLSVIDVRVKQRRRFLR